MPSFAADRSAAVPGADVLADIAAEDLPADGLAKLLGDGALLLDGEVGDAARGVHLVRGHERVGGAGVDAARAASAAIGRDLKFCSGGHRKRGDDDAEQQPRTQLLIDDAGIFADPADACLGGHGPLDERAGVDVAAGLAGEALEQGGFDLTQTAEELIVIVGGDEFVCRFASVSRAAAPGVSGDPSGVGRVRGRSRAGPVAL